MPRLPVKKLRKQLKLLLLLALLTSAAWFTYLHISLVRQGRALRLPFAYSKGNGAGGSPGSPRSGVSGGFGGPQGVVGVPPPPLRVPEHLWFVGPQGVPGLPPALGSQSTWGLGVPKGFEGPPATLETRSTPSWVGHPPPVSSPGFLSRVARVGLGRAGPFHGLRAPALELREKGTPRRAPEPAGAFIVPPRAAPSSFFHPLPWLR